MKKKSMIGLIALIAVLTIGIGYASVSSVNLNITGTASVTTEGLKVVLSSASPTTGAYYGAVSATPDLSGTIHVEGLSEVGTSKGRTITYTITNNESSLSALVTEGTHAIAKSEYYDVITDIPVEGLTIPAGGHKEVKVTVYLKKVPIEAADSMSDITVKFVATPVQP